MVPSTRSSGDSQAGLLREARAASRAGDLSEAERLYRRVLDKEPHNVEALLGLGTVVTDLERKAGFFKQVLEVDPENEEATASLERLRAVLPAEESAVLTCAFHPQVETVLRCSQCGRPICVRCAQHYPVGQLCPLCVRGRRPLHYQAGLAQLAAVGAATLVASAVAGLLATFVAGWSLVLAILAGPIAGSLLAQVALWAGRRRRGLAVQITIALCIVVGSLLGGALLLQYGVLNLAFLAYVALATGSAVAWLR